MPLTAAVAIGYAAPAEVALAAEEEAPPAEDAALRTADDALCPALETAEETDSAAELTAELAEPAASEADSVTPLEKMVVLPIVLVMVLPSVVMVERISEVVIAPAWSSQQMIRWERRNAVNLHLLQCQSRFPQNQCRSHWLHQLH
jgi:hypothetical protein